MYLEVHVLGCVDEARSEGKMSRLRITFSFRTPRIRALTSLDTSVEDAEDATVL